jgi:hypothetical protein
MRSVVRGSMIIARRPLASTPPSTELSASLLTTSIAGRLLRLTAIASSSRLAGATRLPRRLIRRSMTSASPTTEHRIRGQIGQPAACMIDSNRGLSGSAWRGQGGGAACWLRRLWPVVQAPLRGRPAMHGRHPEESTASVDKLVGNCPATRQKPRQLWPCFGLLKIEAAFF